MFPKEKAQELYDKCYNDIDGYGIVPVNYMKVIAKESASMCVEQIIYAINNLNAGALPLIEVDQELLSPIEYWQEVQEEINKF